MGWMYKLLFSSFSSRVLGHNRQLPPAQKAQRSVSSGCVVHVIPQGAHQDDHIPRHACKDAHHNDLVSFVRKRLAHGATVPLSD